MTRTSLKFYIFERYEELYQESQVEHLSLVPDKSTSQSIHQQMKNMRKEKKLPVPLAPYRMSAADWK